MAAPRDLYVIKCGLEIQLINQFSGADVTDSSLQWEYRITNGIKITDNTSGEEECRLNGWLSPFASVTLSEEQLDKAGIPKIAKTFAFMYPPQDVAEMHHLKESCLVIGTGKHGNNEDEFIKSAITRGGFAYFDSDLKLLQINAVSRKVKENTYIRFAGPFEVSDSTCHELDKMKKQQGNVVCRTQTLAIDRFREAGFVSYAWIRPGEKFKHKPAIMNYENEHGSFVYIRENGTGVAYAVVRTEHVVSTDNVGILSDVFGIFNDSKSYSKETIYESRSICRETMKSITEVKTWKTKNECVLNIKNVENLIDTLPNQNTLFHMSCHADIDTNFIAFMLESQGNRNLSHKDTFGWNPLHYACRFSKGSTIKLLVKADPKAVMTPDHYGRYPLHIACDSSTSVDVINILLEADSSPTKITLTSPTRILKLLPIHFACYHGNTSDSILKALLDADIDGQTVVTKTVYGQLPLHLAIIKKLPESMVEMLLNADSKLQVSQSDVYCTFEGKLPLHWACWNNSSPKIIKLLLEKDKRVYETLRVDASFRGNENYSMSSPGNSESSSLLDKDLSLSESDRDDLSLSESDRDPVRGNSQIVSTELTTRDVAQQNSEERNSGDGVALHLAMKHGCVDVIGLLVQKETGSSETNRYIYEKDGIGRTPLHIACEHNVNSQVIRELLKLDSTKETVQTHDKRGYRPLHYACRNKSTCIDTINILCNAEEQRITYERKIKTTGAKDQHQKSPLYLAITAGAKEEIIDRLLQSNKFGFECFDESTMNKLATMITDSKTIQNRILVILSYRLYFSVLMIEFYANIIALAAFIYGSSKLRTQEGGIIEPFLLLICTFIFIVRELSDIMSLGKAYVRDLWNLSDICCVTLLITTAVHMFQQAKNPNEESIEEGILCLTGFSLVIQLITFLRAMLLPFATFVGGLQMIVKELIPFIIILMLMNLAFAYMYWISEKKLDCQEEEASKTLASYFFTKFGDLFDFEPQDECIDTDAIDMIFGFIIIIVLLNVVIAIVSETWRSTENESMQFLWESRLQRIRQLQYALHLQDKLTGVYPQIEHSKLLHFIDNQIGISYQNDISWTKAPYNLVTERARYENPKKYFSTDVAEIILATKSLSADLYWAEMDARNNGTEETDGDGQLKSRAKLVYIFKWFGSCALYAFLIIIGFVTGGIFWPRNFRSGVLSVK